MLKEEQEIFKPSKGAEKEFVAEEVLPTFKPQKINSKHFFF